MRKHRVLGWMAPAALAGAALAGPEAACASAPHGARGDGAVLLAADDGERSVRGRLIARNAPGQAGTARETIRIVSVQDDRRVEVTIENGEIKATINGERVPDSRVSLDGDRLVVLLPDGREALSTRIQRPGGSSVVETDRLRASALEAALAPRMEGGVITPSTVNFFYEPPRVLIGVTMSEAEPLLLEHLGVDVERAIRIESVMDDLPAKRAGVQPNDILIAINDRKNLTPDDLRAFLRDKNPGDKVTLRLIRRGQERTVELALAENPAAAGTRPQARREMLERALLADGERAAAQARERGAEAARQRQLELREIMDRVRRDADATVRREDIQRLVETIEELVANRVGAPFVGDVPLLDAWGQGLMVPRQGGMAPRYTFVPATPSPSVDARVLERLEALSERLERLERQLDRLSTVLERLER